MRLNHAQLLAFNRVLLEIHHGGSMENPLERLTDLMTGLMPATWFSADIVRVDGTMEHQVGRNLDGIADLAEGVLRYGRENPIVLQMNRTGVQPAARMSEVITFRQFSQSAFYAEVMRKLTGFRDQAALLVLMPNRQTVGFTLNREKEFTAEEQFLLELLQPHVKQVLYRSTQYAQLPVQPPLTVREREVLHWLAEGKRDSEIAAILKISERTASQHVRIIMQKLGVESRTAAAAVAWRARLAEAQKRPDDE